MTVPTCWCGEPAVTRLVGPDGATVATWCTRYACRREGYADARMALGTAAYCTEVTA